MKLINKIKNLILPKTIKPQYQWIIHHTRATDRVFFGPFSSYKEIDKFFDDPKNQHIQCNVELLIGPDCPREQYWYNPLEELIEKHPYLFERDSV